MPRQTILILFLLILSSLCQAADVNVTATKIWIQYSNGEHDLITGADIQNSNVLIKDDSTYTGPQIVNVSLANPKGSTVTAVYYYETFTSSGHPYTGWIATYDGSEVTLPVDQETPPLPPSTPYALNYLQQGGITSVDINTNNKIVIKQYAINTDSGRFMATTPEISNQ
jgi:hypothetical protein